MNYQESTLIKVQSHTYSSKMLLDYLQVLSFTLYEWKTKRRNKGNIYFGSIKLSNKRCKNYKSFFNFILYKLFLQIYWRSYGKKPQRFE